MKKILLLLILISMAGGYWYFQQKDEEGSDKKGKAVPVVVSEIFEKELYDSVEALGTTIANESINITANTAETISEIHFEDGQNVKKGDIIVLLEQEEEQALMRGAEAQLEEHKREAKRLKNLLKNKATSKRTYDERKTQLEITEQEIKSIKATIEERTLRAPFDGVLGLRRLSVGALVQPGDVITTLDDTSKIKLDFNVPDVYLSKLKTGMSIKTKSVSLGDRVFNGNISTIDSRVDPVTRSVLVRAIIPNDQGLIRPGLLMQVTMLQGERRAVVAPEEAIFQKQDKHYVYVVNTAESNVSQKEVKVGTRRPGIVEIVSGLSSGDDLVVVRGIHRIRDGQEINIIETMSGEK